MKEINNTTAIAIKAGNIAISSFGAKNIRMEESNCDTTESDEANKHMPIILINNVKNVIGVFCIFI